MMLTSRTPSTGSLAILVAAIVLLGATGAVAQTPSASPSPSPSGSASPAASPSAAPSPSAAISLLNPSPSYDPGFDPTGADDPPKVSDKGGPYHIVAWTQETPPNAIVEASIRYPNQNEITIGLMSRVGDDAWEYSWDVPPNLATGEATIIARLYSFTSDGIAEVDADEVVVEMRHVAEVIPSHDASPDETVELMRPTVNGELGFFKPRSGSWRAAVAVRGSLQTKLVIAFYSASRPGTDPDFQQCGRVQPLVASPVTTAEVICTLATEHVPSQVTAVAVVAAASSNTPGSTEVFNQESADAHRVHPYLQEPRDMTVSVTPWARVLPGGCAVATVTVTDSLGQPAVGASVDVHASGPDDRLSFGSLGSSFKAPQEGGHATGPGTTCTGVVGGQLGRHRMLGAPDVVHAESSRGTGLDGPAGVRVDVNEWRVTLFSTSPGFTDITVWVDEESIESEDAVRGIDNDVLDDDEPFAVGRVQWYEKPPRLSLEPAGSTATSGACVPFVVKARSGTQPVAEVNVDVHATGPVDDLGFCDPAWATERRGPDADPASPAAPHQHGEDRQASHPGTVNAQTGQTGPRTIHTEGETDRFGNFVVGVTAASLGDSIVTAWIDGEPSVDNDIQAGNEPAVTGTIAWGSGEPRISFLNPSAYGGSTQGSGTGTQLPDSGGKVTLLARVDSAVPVDGVEFLVSSDGKKTFKELGPAIRIDGTDVWSLPWPITLADGNYALRARIAGTGVSADIDVKLGAGDQAPFVPNPPYETLRLSRLVPGGLLSFRGDVTTLEGVASAGAEGVDLFYTKVASKDTPKAADWIFCGYVDLDGLGSASQSFAGSCRLAGGDQAAQVSGVAAITYDCTVSGCDANPTPASVDPRVPPPARQGGQKDSGDALRIFGFEAHPLLAIEPAEAEGPVGSCIPFEVVLRDQTGQPMGGENIDLHVPDQGGAVALCQPETGSAWHLPEEGEHTYEPAFPDPPSDAFHQHEADESRTYHVEATTPPSGTLVFGLTSSRVGDASALVWLDRNDDDLQGPHEPSDPMAVHLVPAPVEISVRASDTTPARGSRITIRGAVEPMQPETTVVLQRRKGQGWVTIARTELNERSRYSFRLSASWQGSRNFRVRWKKQHQDYTANSSNGMRISTRG